MVCQPCCLSFYFFCVPTQLRKPVSGQSFVTDGWQTIMEHKCQNEILLLSPLLQKIKRFWHLCSIIVCSPFVVTEGPDTRIPGFKKMWSLEDAGNSNEGWDSIICFVASNTTLLHQFCYKLIQAKLSLADRCLAELSWKKLFFDFAEF